MSGDKYRALREMPFDVVARALGIDLSKFRSRKGGAEWAGNCPVHQPKKNGTAFSYSVDGKWHCVSCQAKGRGAIDLTMAVRGLGFQDWVDLLTPYAATAAVGITPRPQIKQLQVVDQPTKNPPFKGTYEKFFKPHTWLAERGLEPETLERFGVGFYENPARKSVYNGSVMLRIARYSDGETVGYLSRNVGEITPEKPKYRF